MSRRRQRRSTPTAAEMPRLRDQLIEESRTYLSQSRESGDDEDAATFAVIAEGLREAELWWVTKPMVAMARTAAESLIEWTPSLCRPSRSGLVIWDGGSGLVGEHASADVVEQLRGVMVETVGALWLSDVEGLKVMPLCRTPRGVSSTSSTGYDLDGMVIAVDETGRARDGAQAIWDMVGATWLLAQQPTVGHTWGVRYDRWDPDRPFARPAMPGRITVVTLRELAHADGDRGGEIDEQPIQKRGGLTHRHMVRGHWRQQACGPERRSRKPVFVIPYVKGPVGADLIVKPAVKVWRR